MSKSIIASSPTLVNIGTHSLALYAHGPDPVTSNEPVVLFVSGVASTALVWAAVIRLLPTTIRSYTYDRSGYRNSETSPIPPTAENVALELSLLIEKAPISNPLIIVGHSWAGVLIHEFIHLKGHDSIAGLVLVDANHETAPQVLDVYDATLSTISEGVELYSGAGIEAEHKLTREEWAAFRADEATDKFKLIEQKEEFEEYVPSFETLRKKQLGKRNPLVGDKPVHIIVATRSRDWSGFYKAGVAKGNGTEEQRSYVRDLIRTADEKNEGLQREFLKISTKAKLVCARQSGHFVQLTEPEIVVEGVNWVLDESRTPS